MLDKPFPPCYNGNIIIEKKEKMKTYQRFKTGDLIKFGKFYGVVLGEDNNHPGMWRVLPQKKESRVIRIFQNLAIEVYCASR